MSEIDTPALPAFKDAYSFDDTTREVLGCVQVFLSPLEAIYYLPHNVVEIAPPDHLAVHERARLNADGNAWDVIPDYRRCMLWDTHTCTPIPNTLTLGDDLPVGITAQAPPVLSHDTPLTNVWDDAARAWRQLPDYSRTPVWSKDTGLRAASPTPRDVLPDALTVIAPPLIGDHQAVQWNAQHESWDVITEPSLTPPTDALAMPSTPAPTTDEA
jgi:hypothetical protein